MAIDTNPVILDVNTAISIINEYKSGYEDDTPMPESDYAKISWANELYLAAVKAFNDENMKKDKTINNILFIGNSPIVAPRRSSGGISESDEREGENYTQRIPPEAMIAIKENLPVPQHIEGDPEPLPRDLSALLDKDIRRFSGIYNAYLARTTYLLGVESADLLNSNHLLEAAKARVLRTMDKSKKLAKVIEAEIMADEEVAAMSKNVVDHEKNVTVLKALKEIYSGNVDRLSREWTMRQNEWEKGR